VHQIVEDATANYASDVAYGCSWTSGEPDSITVGETRVTVRYGGALPQAVAGSLKDNIIDELRASGYTHTVTVTPTE
jgi:hypothetical protein